MTKPIRITAKALDGSTIRLSSDHFLKLRGFNPDASGYWLIERTSPDKTATYPQRRTVTFPYKTPEEIVRYLVTQGYNGTWRFID